MTRSLFDESPTPYAAPEPIAPGAVLLRGFALDQAETLIQAAQHVIVAAPLRHLITPGGRAMSVGMSNCGALGWTSSRTGYRYASTNPLTGQPWPPMPGCFGYLARRAAAEAGFDGFAPDACLINRYEPGARLSLHQDRDESDLGAPIVSVSLGLPAVFCSAVCSAATARPACGWRTATWRCGAARRGWRFMAWCRWPMVTIRAWGASAST